MGICFQYHHETTFRHLQIVFSKFGLKNEHYSYINVPIQKGIWECGYLTYTNMKLVLHLGDKIFDKNFEINYSLDQVMSSLKSYFIHTICSLSLNYNQLDQEVKTVLEYQIKINKRETFENVLSKNFEIISNNFFFFGNFYFSKRK
jgi:hypothetical protein